jgi:hypothetical protein
LPERIRRPDEPIEQTRNDASGALSSNVSLKHASNEACKCVRRTGDGSIAGRHADIMREQIDGQTGR